MGKVKINVNTALPYLILGSMFVIFGITTKGQIFTASNLMNLFNQSAATIIAGLGMMFVAAMGGTDITHGSLAALAATFASMAAMAVGAWAMIPVAILTGALSGFLLGVINARFKVPSFMVSLSLLIAYRALVNLLLNSASYIVPDAVKVLDGFWVKLLCVVVMALVAGYVLKSTPFGRYTCAIGENENAVKFTGVNVNKTKIAAYVISGVMAAIAGIFLVARVGGTNNTLGSGFEMKVMMAMFIGGIPVQGGFGTKTYKLILGAPTIILLENGLVLLGATGGVTQLIRGLLLLLAVFIAQFVYARFGEGKANRAGKSLPGAEGLPGKQSV